MRVTFLGSGTSGGVPVVNCDCSVCRSLHPKNKRLRSSVLLEINDLHILVDTSPDLRQQLLRTPVPRIDAVLYTHAHADHIFGLDELRRFNWLQKERIPAYAHTDAADKILEVFDYAFGEGPLRPGVPNLSMTVVDEPFEVQGVTFQPLPIMHGKQEIYGFRLQDFAYCTDLNHIPETTYPLLEGLDVLVLDALREKPHATHFSLEQAIAEAKKIKARKTYFTHISHILDHEVHGQTLPANCAFAYDGLVLEL